MVWDQMSLFYLPQLNAGNIYRTPQDIWETHGLLKISPLNPSNHREISHEIPKFGGRLRLGARTRDWWGDPSAIWLFCRLGGCHINM